MATKIKAFQGIGEYSSGSLLLSDLIPAAFDAIGAVLRWAPDKATADRVAVLQAEFDGMDDPDSPDSEDATWLYEELSDLIGNALPTGLFWGGSEGDGASVGIWVSDPADSDLPRVFDFSDLDDLPGGVSEAYVVNDHGNVSYMVRTESGWQLVWDCV